LKGEYKDSQNIPENIKHILETDPHKLAQEYGMYTPEEELESAIQEAIDYDGPVLLDFIVEPFEMVYPWVLAGKPINQVLLTNECNFED
jgi:thiamine pyrophosphate-dependent acetolactate synthase large subunit-like protein